MLLLSYFLTCSSFHLHILTIQAPCVIRVFFGYKISIANCNYWMSEGVLDEKKNFIRPKHNDNDRLNYRLYFYYR